MARDLSCPSGKKAYKTKADALVGMEVAKGDKFVPLSAVKRCDRCRFWHRTGDAVRRGGGTRK